MRSTRLRTRGEFQAATAPPRTPRNSRRRMSAPRLRRQYRIGSSNCFDRAETAFRAAPAQRGRCALWVISRHGGHLLCMSALPPIADIRADIGDVRFVPIADIVGWLFDHLVGARVQARRNVDALCRSGFEVDHQFERGRFRRSAPSSLIRRQTSPAFAPKRTLVADMQCPLSANGRHRVIHSITSSARASSIGGTSIPSAFAVLALMMRRNRVGCSIGRSAGFTPLRTRST